MSPLARLLAVLLAVLGLHSAGSAARLPSDVRSITIHNNAGVSVTVTNPAEVAAIVRWFDALPRFVARPCPNLLRTPPKVRFEFRGPHGSVAMRATARRPGTCSGEVTYSDTGQVKHAALADDGFVARISKLLGVSFDPNARTEENLAAAKLDVAEHLGLVRVPAGSRTLTKPKAPRLYRSFAQADARRAWRVHLPFPDVVAFEKAHPPRGSSRTSTYAESDRAYSNTITLQFHFRPFAHRVSGRTINIEIDSLPDGWTRISVEAFDTWVVVRSLNEKVPEGVREIVIHGPAPFHRRITRPEQIARIVHWIDALPVAEPTRPVCFGVLLRSSMRVTIEFLGAGRTELATVEGWGLSGACYSTIGFSIGGRAQAPLVGGDVLRRIEHLPH